MCGIFGYVGAQNGVPIVLDGLQKIEYRGYDSSGIAIISKNKTIHCVRAVGKVSELEKRIEKNEGSCVVAHTRWATHGEVTLQNTHPISDHTESLAVVHNGIIENFATLKAELKASGIQFRTDTDTEVLSNLISKSYKGNLLDAVTKALKSIQGAWAIAVVHKDHPNECIVAKNSCPLVVGLGSSETYVASDPNALVSRTRKVHFLHDGEIARLTPTTVEFFDVNNMPVSKEAETLLYSVEDAVKGSYEHYTLKEIFEQPTTIRNAMDSRFVFETGHVVFEELAGKLSEILAAKRVVIVACGTSYHAGLVASYILEEMARIPTSVEISSEYRYKNPIVEDGTLAIAISQSGETADTLAAVKELKSKGAQVIGLCNVQGSTLTRVADATILLRAGPEIGVCSTKAFTSQLTVLTLFAIMLARHKHLTAHDAQKFFRALEVLPDQVSEVLHQQGLIRSIAEKYRGINDFFFIGRKYMYPSSLEGALKLKEIAYVNANGYAAGEIKHGPIALLSENCPTIALACDSMTYEKMVSNITEVKARKSPVFAVIDHKDPHLFELVDDVVIIPKTTDELSPIVTTVVCQLFAYYSASLRGADIDKPKNLAKSVTVE